MGAIFLAFSSVLNDVKGVLWLDAVLLDSRPDDSTSDEMKGQWHGIQQQVTSFHPKTDTPFCKYTHAPLKSGLS